MSYSNEFLTADNRLSSRLTDASLADILSNCPAARKTLTCYSRKRPAMATTQQNESNSFQPKKKSRNNGVERIFNKHAPTEEPIYSKPKTYTFPASQEVNKKKGFSRDPRFDNLSGNFDAEFFDENYKFLNELKDNEMRELQKEEKEAGTEEERKNISRLVQKFKEEKRARNKREVTREIVSKNLDEQIAQLEEGKKPYYMKKSKLKELVRSALIAKGLERESKKRLKNRAVKTTQKSRKHFPNRR
ncbi:ribosomal RNA processing protein 36 homolog [Convolutriloba macropyga]|uniref:ribosomal RNA processing protein 36 homolog n=1 Tax=Convolutriloba macropyga TaxID=536237 RepID=UPI003F524FB0